MASLIFFSVLGSFNLISIRSIRSSSRHDLSVFGKSPAIRMLCRKALSSSFMNPFSSFCFLGKLFFTYAVIFLFPLFISDLSSPTTGFILHTLNRVIKALGALDFQDLKQSIMKCDDELVDYDN